VSAHTPSQILYTQTHTPEDGDVLSCGRGREGQLGNGQRRNSAELQPPHGLTHCTLVDIAAGAFHTAAVTASGLVYQWGLVSDAPAEPTVNGPGSTGAGDTPEARGVLPGMQQAYVTNALRDRIAAASAEQVRHFTLLEVAETELMVYTSCTCTELQHVSLYLVYLCVRVHGLHGVAHSALRMIVLRSGQRIVCVL
jgi:Regulator of chromosome condensation (RCC1) repeat